MSSRTSVAAVVLAALVAFAAVALVACGGDGGGGYGGGSRATTTASPPASPAGGGSVTADQISIRNFSFTPGQTIVEAGTTVTWTNDDTTPHDVTSTDGPGIDAATTSTFASETLAEGDSFSFTFEEPGMYYYECAIHASTATMHAVVIVE